MQKNRSLNIKAIFFDIDDTLYDKNVYMSSAFKSIAQFLSNKYSISYENIIDDLWNIYDLKGSLYKKLFNDLLDKYNLFSDELILTLIDIFHCAPTYELHFYKDVEEVLPRIKRHYFTGIITNGNRKMQMRKVHALGLKTFTDIQIYAEELGFQKPSSNVFLYALKKTGVKPTDSIYIGDNPPIDFPGARNIGMKTVRLLRGEFAHLEQYENIEDFRINNFYELEEYLANNSKIVSKG